MPLSVSLTSECEHADFRLDTEIEHEFTKKAQWILPDGIKGDSGAFNHSKKNIMATVRRADYELEVFTDEVMAYDDASGGLAAMLDATTSWWRRNRGKRGETTVKAAEIRPLILDVAIEELGQYRRA